MSVLIKVMEKPNTCYSCPLKKREGMDIVCPILNERFSVADINILYYRLQDCPIVPVSPHGDLIDLRTVNLSDGPYEYNDWIEWALEQYLNAPVFIPADNPKVEE